jgi:hypothetical protein
VDPLRDLLEVELLSGMPPISVLPQEPFKLIIRSNYCRQWLGRQDKGYLCEVDLHEIDDEVDLPHDAFAPIQKRRTGKTSHLTVSALHGPEGCEELALRAYLVRTY